MVKLVFLCRRRGDISHEEYVRRLLVGHVPLALRHHPTLRRYVVNVVEEASPGAPELDSIGELWFDSLADYRDRLYDSPAGARAIARDVADFLARADAYVTTEHVQRAPAGTPPTGRRTSGDKLFACLQRVPAMSPAQFAAHWQDRHAPLALRHHDTTRYIINVVEERVGDATPYDGFGELTFPPGEMQKGMYLSPEGKREIEADIPRFIGSVHAYVVAEYVQRW